MAEMNPNKEQPVARIERPLCGTTVKVKGNARVIARFQRLIALMHYSSAWGHSGIFGMPLDGDGAEVFEVVKKRSSFDVSRYRDGVAKLTKYGWNVELAHEDGYFGKKLAENDGPKSLEMAIRMLEKYLAGCEKDEFLKVTGRLMDTIMERQRELLKTAGRA